MTLLIAAVLFTIAGIMTVRFRRSVKTARRDTEEAETCVLLKIGLELSGDVLDTFELRGSMHGVEIELANGKSAQPPGASEGYVSACAARVAVPIADQIVCKVAEIDQIMGVLPAAPRVRTGHAQFDATYAIFVMPTGEVTGGSYRGAPEANTLVWAKSSLLDRLLELDLLWLRVRDGFADVVFPRLPVEEVGRAVALALAVARAAQRKPLPTLSAGPRARWHAWQDEIMNPFWSIFTVILLGITCGPWVAQIHALTFLDNEFICGRGDQMVPISSDSDDFDFALRCLQHPEKSLALHWVGGIVLFMAIVALAIVLLVVWYDRKDHAVSRATRLLRSKSLLAMSESAEVYTYQGYVPGNEG